MLRKSPLSTQHVSDDLCIINEDEEDGSSTNVGSSSTAVLPITKDGKLVLCSRVAVMTVLLLTALIIAGMAYHITSGNEHKHFINQFKASTDQIEHMANKNALNIFLSVKTLSHLFPSAGHQAAGDLPFVTVEDYEKSAEDTRILAKASVITYSPVLRTATDLQAWSAYSVNQTFWITEGKSHRDLSLEDEHATLSTTEDGHHSHGLFVHNIPEHVYSIDSTGRHVVETGDGLRAPLWQTSPAPVDVGIVNLNLASNSIFAEVLKRVLRGKRELVSKVVDAKALFGQAVDFKDDGSPSSLLMMPLFDSDAAPDEVHPVLGVVSALLPWRDFFEDVLPKGHSGITVVADICGENSTFAIDGDETIYIGNGDLHEREFDAMGAFFEFEFSSAGDYHGFYCHQHIYMYPTEELRKTFETAAPLVYSVTIVVLFSFTALIFAVHDCSVARRQARTAMRADKSNAIVQELFPNDVATRLFNPVNAAMEENSGLHAGGLGLNATHTSTIAELYPSATVLFADIAGFTAWSSTREPYQVFTLLESIFQSFDALAKKRGIYKVETIGDCYVAVCGLPKPNAEHAVHMARFAMAASERFLLVLVRLQLSLGPDTVDLGMRFGMHSGPVTAGVLRGDRARFQLFGDTVNTASRIESTGQRNRIHLSEQTAAELTAHGKQDWIVPRQDMIEAKGKGKLVTYWLKQSSELKATGGMSLTTASTSWRDSEDSETCSIAEDSIHLDSKSVSTEKRDDAHARLDSHDQKTSLSDDRTCCLVDWNCELLVQLLNRVVARRKATNAIGPTLTEDLDLIVHTIGRTSIVVDEVAEIIDMPAYVDAPKASKAQLSEEAKRQLRSYVQLIASMYNNNPFHNFEHASHVTMSVSKLLSRIVAPQLDLESQSDGEVLHDHTYGITSDPMTQFAVVLSALIHDLDHPGVPNFRLAEENPKLAQRYRARSVAEQNSIDLAWQALLMPEYSLLRSAIFATEAELRRFRQLLVNSIIATDIFDKELDTLRKNRWNKAFFESSRDDRSSEESPRDQINRKATIVIDHLIQASDVAHTMQHWHVYQKWNQRLFNEMMMAYRDGRSDKDPEEGWYGGELWFFDNYVIPLANKLKECGVFGVSSDEYLTYAQQNRSEWADKGRGIVQTFRAEFEAKYPVDVASIEPNRNIALDRQVSEGSIQQGGGDEPGSDEM